jgi:hypothetical protein
MSSISGELYTHHASICANDILHSRLVEDEEPTVPPTRGQELIPPYSTMKSNHWAFSCDLLCRLAIGIQMYTAHLTRFKDSRHKEAAAVNGWSDLSAPAYDSIRLLHDELFTEATYGGWEDMPIIRQNLDNMKRKACGHAGGSPAAPAHISHRRRIA